MENQIDSRQIKKSGTKIENMDALHPYYKLRDSNHIHKSYDVFDGDEDDNSKIFEWLKDVIPKIAMIGKY